MLRAGPAALLLAACASCGGAAFAISGAFADDAGDEREASAAEGGPPPAGDALGGELGPEAGDVGDVGEACALAVHQTGVSACSSSSFGACVADPARELAELACLACSGGASSCIGEIRCGDSGGSLAACGDVGPTLPGAYPAIACWAYAGPLAGLVKVAAVTTCPMAGDPAWH
jgi:hypothetical protein